MLIDCSNLQLAKALFPIFVTFSGISINRSNLQRKKARSPMQFMVLLSKILTISNVLDEENSPFLIMLLLVDVHPVLTVVWSNMRFCLSLFAGMQLLVMAMGVSLTLDSFDVLFLFVVRSMNECVAFNLVCANQHW